VNDGGWEKMKMKIKKDKLMDKQFAKEWN